MMTNIENKDEILLACGSYVALKLRRKSILLGILEDVFL
jgi:hypothetical protein